MQRLLFVVILAIVLIGLPILVLSDTDTPTADVAVSDNEVTGSINTPGNSSAGATIVITMTGVLDE